MAQRVQESIIGVDVSKNTLDVYVLASEESCSISNDSESIEHWLDSCCGPVRVAIEPTNSYRIDFAQATHSRGH
jgi:transposase